MVLVHHQRLEAGREEVEEEVRCGLCSYTTSLASTLRRHIQVTHHQQAEAAPARTDCEEAGHCSSQGEDAGPRMMQTSCVRAQR